MKNGLVWFSITTDIASLCPYRKLWREIVCFPQCLRGKIEILWHFSILTVFVQNSWVYFSKSDLYFWYFWYSTFEENCVFPQQVKLDSLSPSPWRRSWEILKIFSARTSKLSLRIATLSANSESVRQTNHLQTGVLFVRITYSNILLISCCFCLLLLLLLLLLLSLQTVKVFDKPIISRQEFCLSGSPF